MERHPNSQTLHTLKRGAGRQAHRGFAADHGLQLLGRERERVRVEDVSRVVGTRRVVANFWQFLQNFARFRLYRHRSLQLNARFAAFFKIYQII